MEAKNMQDNKIRMSKYTDGNVFVVLSRTIECMKLWANTGDKTWMKVGVMAGWSMETITNLKTKASEIASGNLDDINWLRHNERDINLMMAFAKEHTKRSYGWRANTEISVGKNMEKAEYGAFRWFTSADLRQHPVWRTVEEQD
tara:strand:+ start:312 stop:743 length:432 start_codon:yes stop_codon:yes gene_type:complete